MEASSNPSARHRAIVLGAAVDRENIGSAIVRYLSGRENWAVDADDCKVSGTKDTYRIPSIPMGKYDALVISLGTAMRTAFDKDPFTNVDRVIHANLMLPLAAIHAYIEARSWNDLGGKVVVIGSYAHDHVLSESVAYCAAKAGLVHAIRALAWDLAGDGFRFHSVNPYHVPSTQMGANVLASMMKNRGMSREEAEAYQMKDLRMDQHLTPWQIAEQVGFLVSQPSADWQSGQAVNLYGGTR